MTTATHPQRRTLFEITEDVRALELTVEEWIENQVALATEAGVEWDGDISKCRALEDFFKAGEDLERKVLNIGLLIKERTTFGKSVLGEGAAFKDLWQDYERRGKAHVAFADALKKRLLENLTIPFKYENEKVRVRSQKNGQESIIIEADATPEDFGPEFYKDPEIDNSKVKEAAKVVAGIIGRAILKGERVLARVVQGSHVRVE
jgi:hypothetical protein